MNYRKVSKVTKYIFLKIQPVTNRRSVVNQTGLSIAPCDRDYQRLDRCPPPSDREILPENKIIMKKPLLTHYLLDALLHNRRNCSLMRQAESCQIDSEHSLHVSGLWPTVVQSLLRAFLVSCKAAIRTSNSLKMNYSRKSRTGFCTSYWI